MNTRKQNICMSHKKTEIEKYREQVERLTKLLEEKETETD
jgi:cell shape-determining protein MreC